MVETRMDSEAPRAIPPTPICCINVIPATMLQSRPTKATALIMITCLIAMENFRSRELHTKKGSWTKEYCITRVTCSVALPSNLPPSKTSRIIGSDHRNSPALMGTVMNVASSKKNDSSRFTDTSRFLATSIEKCAGLAKLNRCISEKDAL